MTIELTASPAVVKAKQLVMAANRILARENVVDGYGHVSMRHPEHPDRFLLSRSRSPELVDVSDIMEFTLDGKVYGDDPRPAYLERFIHGSIYAARKDVNSVVHSHAEDVVPYSLSKAPLIAVWHQSCSMGEHCPVWDIRKHFGDTNLLVATEQQGRDLAKALGKNNVVLMRGHGFACAAPSVYEAVKIAVYLPVNARILTTATLLGKGVRAASRGEIGKAGHTEPETPAFMRGWEYWLTRAGVQS